MVQADTTVPWGSVRKEILAAPLPPVEGEHEATRAGSGQVLATEEWNPVCVVCPRCGGGCERHRNAPDGTKCAHEQQSECGCNEWGPARLMVRETEKAQEEKMRTGSDVHKPGGVGRTAEGWRAFFAHGGVKEGGSSSSPEAGDATKCSVCSAEGELKEKRAGRTLCRVCLTPW